MPGLISLISLSLAASAPAAPAACAPPPLEQLRIYEIFDTNKAAFHDRFRDHGLRIMKRHGFDVAAMWETSLNGRTELAYVLRWPDEVTMKKQWAAFLADEEWIRIKKEWAALHGRAVGEIQDRTLRRTPYSPC